MFLLTKPKGAAASLNEGLIARWTFDDAAGDILHERLGLFVSGTGEIVVIVDGAGSAEYDGIYRLVSNPNGFYIDANRTIYYAGNEINGYPVYENENGMYLFRTGAAGQPRFWSLNFWVDGVTAAGEYFSEENADLPGGTWTISSGDSPAPDITLISGSGNPLDGTLTGFSPTYAIVVNGGSFTDATFTPSGTEYGKAKYLSPDGNTKVSYWYMMDPEMDGAWYIWAANATEPWMDGYDAEAYTTGDAWDGSYSNSYTVAQGSLQPGPWFGDGLLFPVGDVRVAVSTPSEVEPGTGDFSVAIDYIYLNPVGSGFVSTLFQWSGGGKTIRVQRWYSDPNYDTPYTRIYINDGTHSITGDISGTAPWIVGQANRIAVVFHRASVAYLYLNGELLGSVSISTASGSLSGMGYLDIGSLRTDAYGTWSFNGKMRRFEYWNRALTADEAIAWTGTTDHVAVMPRLPLFAFVPGDAPATGAYYYRYLTSLWTEAQ